MSHSFDPTALREYDIRGVVGRTLGEDDAFALGRSFATLVRRGGGRSVAVGRDGRESSPRLEAALVRGLNASGADVVRIGSDRRVSISRRRTRVGGGIMITGATIRPSIMASRGARPQCFFGEDIQHAAGSPRRATGKKAAARSATSRAGILRERLVEGFDGGATDRLGCGQWCCGAAVELLTARCRRASPPLYDIDSRFPNHHPIRPTKNLTDLKRLVRDKGLDFGVAFDGDGDRIGAVDGEGASSGATS